MMATTTVVETTKNTVHKPVQKCKKSWQFVCWIMHNRFMNLTLDICKLTRAEKLRAMEALWKDLSQSGEGYPTPEWHGDVLRERAAAVEDGSDVFISWEDAKKKLREREA